MALLAHYTVEDVQDAFEHLAQITAAGEVLMDLKTYQATARDCEVAMLFLRALKTECDRVRIPSRIRLHREAMELQATYEGT